MDPLQYFVDLERLGIKFGLENIRALAGALGNPQEAWRSVIVAGTNGKGSVAAMIERGLRAAGYRTGLYTSPHLVRLEERFRIDGRPVETSVLGDQARAVQETVARLRADGTLTTEPTVFEATTAAAFRLFREAGIGVAVLEVGLGGRFDATNLASPMAAAITTIDFDHEALLGHTLADIAFEKAGVIKAGMTVIAGDLPREAGQVVDTSARERGARLVRATEGTVADVTLEEGRGVLDLTTPHRRYGPLRLSLRGRHQAANAVVAARLLEELAVHGIDVPAPAIVSALTDTSWRGRLDLVELGARRLLVDAAHNPAGARVLAEYLRDVHPAGLPLVFGAMRDKNIPGMLAALLPSATHVIATAPRVARAADPDEVAAEARRQTRVPVVAVTGTRAALDEAWSSGATVCVAGSIYLAGEALAAVGG